MAFGAQTITKTLHAYGHCELHYNSNTASPTAIGPIKMVQPVNFEPETLEVRGWNATGVEQRAALHLLTSGSGDFDFTMEEVVDVDTVAWLNVELDNIRLRQLLPAASSKAWELTAALGKIICLNREPGGKELTKQTFRFMGYAAPGTAVWVDNTNATP